MDKMEKAVRQLQHMGVDACFNYQRQVSVRSGGFQLRLHDSVVDLYAGAYDERALESLAQEDPREVLMDVATILDRLDLDKLDGCWDTEYVVSSIEYLRCVGEAFRRKP